MARFQPRAEDFDKAVLALYDAGLGTRDWSEALGMMGGMCGAFHEGLNVIDDDRLTVLARRTGRVPELTNHWYNEWAAKGRCLRLNNIPKYRSQSFAVDYDFIDKRGIRRSAYYNDLTEKYDFAYFLGARVRGLAFANSRHSMILYLCFGHRHGHVQGPDVSLARRFLPHIKRALEIEHLATEKAAHEQAASNFADDMTCGVVNVGSNAEILSLSPSAERFIGKGDGLRKQNTRLSACLHSDALALQSLIRETAKIDPDHPPEASTIAVHRAGGKLPLLLTVAPLPFQSAEFLNILSAGAVVYIFDPEAENAANKDALMSLFKLTETEAQTAALFLSGMGVEEIARYLGTTPATVRFHFRNIFKKCNASGQVDLMRILKTGLTPLSRESERA